MKAPDHVVAAPRDDAGKQAAGSHERRLSRRQWRQLLLITAAAVTLYVTLRLLPTGTNLNHMDFRVEGKGIDFCDPLNPQFIPVVAVRSPVTLGVVPQEQPVAGREVRGVVVLRTSGGKPIAPADLLVVHERRLHLMIADPTLTDYQHLHPRPLADGEWEFAFTPRRGGLYRIFADFTPVATARGLYASADLPVQPAASGGVTRPAQPMTAGGSEGALAGLQTVRNGGFVFALRSPAEARAGQPLDFRFSVHRDGGGEVPLKPVMGAYAHLVAFDMERTGFAHLHPVEDPAQTPHLKDPELNFKLTIPKAGDYVIWSQVNLDGEEVFVPFGLKVEPAKTE